MRIVDIESFVFAEVAEELRTKYVDEDGRTAIFVVGEYVNAPARFPAVSVVESSNSVLRSMMTVRTENAATLMYEVNVYSNLQGRRKLEAKDILADVDAVFERLGFVRTMANPVANLEDVGIFRIVARYEGVVMWEGDGTDTTYRIYTS